VAAALLAPVLRRLRTWVHGVPEPAVVADREGRIEMGAGARSDRPPFTSRADVGERRCPDPRLSG
jgi:hypothetical protein